MVKQLQHRDGAQLVLAPNCSLSWHGNIKVWLGLCAISGVIVTGMIWVGAWVVFPFAGLELSALAAGFYYTSRQCRQREVLVISRESLRLEKGLYRKQAEWNLPRQYTRVYLRRAPHPFTPPKLYLMHRNDEVSLAAFLNLDDTEALVSMLEKLGLRIEKQQPNEPFWF